MNFNYDYSRTMMMKIKLAKPNLKGGCDIWQNFEGALNIIKQVDALTLGAPKIVYLVGWQYLGHDDKYPAFFEVNNHIKRDEDKTAKESLLWLIEEAKKYNTIVSLHINLSDAYPDSPLWQEYLKNDLILRHLNGKLKVTGVWNGRSAYQVRFAKELESGYFKKRVDKLFDIVPLREIGAIHIDAFFVRKGKDTDIAGEKRARLAMIEYFKSRGVDVTSEFIYREHKNGFRAHFGKSDTIGVIPAFWNPVLSRKDLLKYQASELAGGLQCETLTRDKNLEWLFYGNIQGEEIFVLDDWQKEFLYKFATYNVPYLFLNGYKRERIKGVSNSRIAKYSNNVEVSIKDKKITSNGVILKKNEELCLPVFWRKNGYIAYTAQGGVCRWRLARGNAEIYEISADGLIKKGSEIVNDNGFIDFAASANTGYFIEIK